MRRLTKGSCNEESSGAPGRPLWWRGRDGAHSGLCGPAAAPPSPCTPAPPATRPHPPAESAPTRSPLPFALAADLTATGALRTARTPVLTLCIPAPSSPPKPLAPASLVAPLPFLVRPSCAVSTRCTRAERHAEACRQLECAWQRADWEARRWLASVGATPQAASSPMPR